MDVYQSPILKIPRGQPRPVARPMFYLMEEVTVVRTTKKKKRHFTELQSSNGSHSAKIRPIHLQVFFDVGREELEDVESHFDQHIPNNGLISFWMAAVQIEKQEYPVFLGFRRKNGTTVATLLMLEETRDLLHLTKSECQWILDDFDLRFRDWGIAKDSDK